MATKTPTQTFGNAKAEFPKREISITVRDSEGRPAAGADVKIVINGRPSGLIHTGSGVDKSTVETVWNASIELEVTLAEQTQHARLPPGKNEIRFVFPVMSTLEAKEPARAYCPDGSSGAPCVICRDGKITWKICT